MLLNAAQTEGDVAQPALDNAHDLIKVLVNGYALEKVTELPTIACVSIFDEGNRGTVMLPGT